MPPSPELAGPDPGGAPEVRPSVLSAHISLFSIGFEDIDGGCTDLGPDSVPPTVTSLTLGTMPMQPSGRWYGRQWLLKLRPGEDAAVEVDLGVGALRWTVEVAAGRDVELRASLHGPGGHVILEEGRKQSFSGEAGRKNDTGSPSKFRLYFSNRHSWLSEKTIEVRVLPTLEEDDGFWRNGLTSLSTASMTIPWVSVLLDKTYLKRDVALKAFRLEIVEVQRIAHAEHWERYQRRRAEIAEELRVAAMSIEEDEEEDAPRSVVSLKTITDPLVPLDPNKASNEHWLFHGTSGIAARSIASEAFKRPEKSIHGTAFGEGVYLSECSSKADLYATPVQVDSLPEELEGLCTTGRSSCCFRPRARKHDTLCCMLLCRVALGRALVVDGMWPDKAKIAKDLSTGKFHSVLGDRERVCKSYREFIVQDSLQVNPEFIIWYRRLNETAFQRWKRENLGDEPFFSGLF